MRERDAKCHAPSCDNVQHALCYCLVLRAGLVNSVRSCAASVVWILIPMLLALTSQNGRQVLSPVCGVCPESHGVLFGRCCPPNAMCIRCVQRAGGPVLGISNVLWASVPWSEPLHYVGEHCTCVHRTCCVYFVSGRRFCYALFIHCAT